MLNRSTASTRGLVRIAATQPLAGALLGLTLLALSPSQSFAAQSQHQAGSAAVERAIALEKTAMRWRLAIAMSALLLVSIPVLKRRKSRRESDAAGDDGASDQVEASPESSGRGLGRVSLGLLIVIALASCASYYNFFETKGGVGFKDTDVYHYYMGSKYFSEVGYFDLYHCTILALTDSGVKNRFELPRVRDQRTLRIHTPATTLASALQCREQMPDARWAAFAADVTWFDAKFKAEQWDILLNDHGYNPSPVWNAIGNALSSRIELGSAGFDALINADRILMLVAFTLIVWAFSVEAAALAAIAWGTGLHWGYAWIGDSMLRNLWLFAVLAGLCFLKKQRIAIGGGFLVLASLLRVFPAIFVAGYVVHLFARMRRGESWQVDALQFARGVVTAGVLFCVWAALASDWGAIAFVEFGEKISVFTDQKSLNKLGLSSLVWRSIMMGTGHLTTNAAGGATLASYSPAWLPVVIRCVQLAVALPALFLFWRAAQRVRGWELAALGFALIPLLSDPANYYFGFVVCGAILAAQRPRLQVIVLGSCTAWLANALWFYRLPEEYLGAGLIAVALPLLVLYELSRGEVRNVADEPGSSALGDTTTAKTTKEALA
jgi:hypothetical protein